MLTGVAQIEHDLDSEGILNRTLDQRAMLGDVAQPDLFVRMAEVDLSHPDQRVAALGPAAVGHRIVILRVA